MSQRLTAHFENREYFFIVTKQVPADRMNTAEELHIEMYKQPYIFLKDKEEWINKDGNRMKMDMGLIKAVASAVSERK